MRKITYDSSAETDLQQTTYQEDAFCALNTLRTFTMLYNLSHNPLHCITVSHIWPSLLLPEMAGQYYVRMNSNEN